MVWNGQKGPPSPALASPSMPSSKQSSASGSYGEFADADEDLGSEGIPSYDDEANTTMTTMSTSGSTGKKPHVYDSVTSTPTMESSISSPTTMRPAVPIRKPPRSTKRPTDDDDAASTYGHARVTSIGSSIWAGRGARTNDEPAPPLPSAVNTSLHSPRTPDPDRFSMAETSSVYSQGAATEWDEGPLSETQRMVDEALGRNGLRHATRPAAGAAAQNTSEEGFEMMDTRSIHSGRQSIESERAPRVLSDGTPIPKMPPIPSEYQSSKTLFKSASAGRLRSGGRRNRSPILSYADGEEQEQRMVQERELREHGGMELTTSNMGPRLKKNSPAPWELDDESEVESIQVRQSSEGMSSRPSHEQLLPPGMKHAGSWARQSMETFRNRNASGTMSPSPSQNSQRSPGGPLTSKDSLHDPLHDAQTSTDSIPPGGVVPRQSTSTDGGSRRMRSKSMSGSAAGVLKGLGLAHSATPPAKKGSRLAKAFRSMSGNTTPNSDSRKASLNMSRGISSEDYANMPPSSNGSSPPAATQASPRTDSDMRSGKSVSAHAPHSALPPMPKNYMNTIHAHDSKRSLESLEHSVSPPRSQEDAVETLDTNPSGEAGFPLRGMSYKQVRLPSDDGHGAGSSSSHGRTSVTSTSRQRKPIDTTGGFPAPDPSDDMAHDSSSQAHTETGADLPKIPSVGAHEGVPYKLISLEEARMQQSRRNEDVGGMSRTISDKSLAETISPDGKGIKNKKSGFLRRFAKDKNDMHTHDIEGLEDPPHKPDTHAPPTLSVRPMSSMFNGFAPDLIESRSALQPVAERDTSNQLSPPTAESKLSARLGTPHSPAITIHSVESGHSSTADYEDALERTPSVHGATAHDNDRLPILTPHSRQTSREHHSTPRKSSESARSDASSALGLVNGFPPTPFSYQDTQAHTGQIHSLASATRNRALEIEAKMADLASELARLRSFATDAGLAASKATKSSSSEQVVKATKSPSLDADTPPSESTSSQADPLALTEKDQEVLHMPVPPCEHCGCDCAEQKRLQALNHLAVLKGIRYVFCHCQPHLRLTSLL